MTDTLHMIEENVSRRRALAAIYTTAAEHARQGQPIEEALLAMLHDVSEHPGGETVSAVRTIGTWYRSHTPAMIESWEESSRGWARLADDAQARLAGARA